MTDNTAAAAPAAKTKAEPVITTVTMQDDRVVDFAGKKRLIKDTLLSADGKVQVRLDFVNGQTRLFTVPDNLLNKFAAHGASQKLGDEIASLKDTDDAVLAIDELIDRLYNGEWNTKREGDGMAGTSVLMKALVESTGQTAEKVKAFLATKSQAEKIALRNNPKIKPIVERIEAEKAAKGTPVDTDALLGELSGAAA